MTRIRFSIANGLLAMSVLLTGCVLLQPPAPVRELEPPAAAVASPRTEVYHRVQRGENLFRIAWQYGVDYQSLAAWNQLAAPYAIYPNQKLRLTAPTAASTEAPLVVATAIDPAAKIEAAAVIPQASLHSGYEPQPMSKSSPQSSDPLPVAPANRAKITKKNPSKAQRLVWQWPSQGELISTFNAKDSQRQGIQISGKSGQLIVAAAAGKVVYSGSALAGYGQLLIIKHNETYLSAYGHNRKILVQEGDAITTGQPIAEMGSFGVERPLLHFEIRAAGKPINPLKVLPPL